MSVKKAIQDIILWRGLNFLSVFILNVLVARTLKASQAGELFFFINNLSLVIVILSFSLESGLGYYAAGTKIALRRLSTWAVVWTLGATFACFFLFDTIGPVLQPVNGIHARWTAIVFIAGTLLSTFFSSLFFAKENFVIPNVLVFIVNLLLIIVFFAAGHGVLDNKWLLNMYFAGYLLQGILILGFYVFSIRDQPAVKNSKDEFGNILKYSSAVFLANFLFFLVYRIDYWFVEKWCTSLELGNYIQVSKIVQWLLLLPMMVSTAIFPLTAMDNDKQMTSKVFRVSRLLLWIYLSGCLVAALIGSWVFSWLFGETYSYMYPVFLLHIPGILALASLYPVSSFNAGIKRVDINLQGSFFALIVIVALNVIFTPTYGIYAASVASSVGYIVYFLFSFYKFNRQHKFSLFDIFKPAASDYLLLKSMFYRRK